MNAIVNHLTVIQLFGAPSIMEPLSREVMVMVTNPVEIASIEANGFSDIVGGKNTDGTYWAYKFSRDEWRERQALL
jgi:hypothetical protein